jgi:hypothetical protein
MFDGDHFVCAMFSVHLDIHSNQQGIIPIGRSFVNIFVDEREHLPMLLRVECCSIHWQL